jgi:predicted RNase H-like nuclease
MKDTPAEQNGYHPAMVKTLIGIDSCRAGWLLATSDASLRSLRFAITTDLRPVFASLESVDAQVAIDMPIGIPDNGARSVDFAARALLGSPRASSVFPVPCRPTLAATTYAEACAINRRASVDGKAVSQQLFAMLSKMRAVDALMSPALQSRVRECHPEVCFAVLSGRGRGLEHSKKTPEGEAERTTLLSRFLPPFQIGAIRATVGAGADRDDIVDALANVVTAHRIASGTATTLPRGRVPTDARGLRMEMLA